MSDENRTAESVFNMEVRGMHCEGCANSVVEAAKSVKGVAKAEVSLERERATIWLDILHDQVAVRGKVRKAIAKAGFLVGDTY